MDLQQVRDEDWDRHVLLLYRSEDHQRSALVAEVGRGLDRGEKVLCMSTAGDTSIPSALVGHGVDVAAAVDDGRLGLLPVEEFYPAAGQGDLVDSALGEGYRAVRIIARADIALSYLAPRRYDEVEEELDALCESLPVSAICQYDARATAVDRLMAVVAGHHGTLDDGSLRVRRTADRLVLAGELDTSSAAVLRELLTASCDGLAGGGLTLDLAELEFVDVEGIRCLMVGTKAFRATGGRVFLEQAQPRVRRVMALLRVGEYDHVFLV